METNTLTLIPGGLSGAVNLNEAFEAYLTDTSVSIHTSRAKRADWGDLKGYLKNGCPTSKDLTAEVLMGYRDYLMASFAPASVNRRLCTLRTFLSWLQGTQLEVRFAVKKLKCVDEGHKLCPKALARRDLNLLLAHLDLSIENLELHANEILRTEDQKQYY